MEVTEEQLEKIFTQWAKNYKENPHWFVSIGAYLVIDGDPVSYGQACAYYFTSLREEILKNGDQ